MEKNLKPEEIGKRLKKLREDNSLTQEELAEILLCPRPSISYFENGVRWLDVNTLFKYMNYFNVSADYILTGKEAQDLEKFIGEIQSVCNKYQRNE